MMDVGPHQGNKASVAIIQGDQANPGKKKTKPRNTHCSLEAQGLCWVTGV